MRGLVLLLALVFAPSIAEASRHHQYQHRHQHKYFNYDSGTIVSHPTGCPRSLFCGCGAESEVFHTTAHEITVGGRRVNPWLAAEWLHFPRTSPAPGMVAANHGHVMVLREDRGGGRWLVYDANSGGGLTRVHERSLAGYAVVDPHGGSDGNVRVASLSENLGQVGRVSARAPVHAILQVRKAGKRSGYAEHSGKMRARPGAASALAVGSPKGFEATLSNGGVGLF